LDIPRMANRGLAHRGLLALVLILAATLPTSVKAFQNPGAQPPKAQTNAPKTNAKDGLRYLWIPPGAFTLGCSPGDAECFGDEKPALRVTLTKGFWLGETEVTQAAYQRVTGKNPSNFKGPSLPVEQVTWIDANNYCRAIGGRLPTEAEWEYAARGGSAAGRYGDVGQIAWYAGNSKSTTHPVGQKQANGYGLHDMLGNVVEWTNDWHSSAISKEAIDPKGPGSGEFKVLRGGGWFDDPTLIRASYRSRIEVGDRDYNIGFRCVGE
jgi:formylglycine-generating enzyme required for sulfatase activity